MNKKKIYRIIGLALMGVSLLGCSSNPLENNKETNLTDEIKVVCDEDNREDDVLPKIEVKNNTENESQKGGTEDKRQDNTENETFSSEEKEDLSTNKSTVNNYKNKEETKKNIKKEVYNIKTRKDFDPIIKENQVKTDNMKDIVNPLKITRPTIKDTGFITEGRTPNPEKEETVKTTSALGEYYVDQFVFFEGTKSDKDLSLIEKRKNLIKTLPDTIISKLIEDNYIICYVSSDTDFISFIKENNGCNETYTKGIGGMCDYKTRTIYLTCNLEYGDKPQTTFHEIGHAIDHYYKLKEGQSLSQRESFLEVYNSDDYTTFFDRTTTYFCQSPSEFFAQNFAYYFCPMLINPMDWDGPKSKEWFEAIRWN